VTRILRSIASIATILATFILAPPALAWQYEEFMNPQGDRGSGIVQAASNVPGIELAFGCDGDRWRQVALLPDGDKPLRLAKDGKVGTGFDREKLTPDGKWKVRKLNERANAYFGPAPTKFMGRLYTEAQKNPNAVLYVRVRPMKKSPIVLEFPLAGLRHALAEHLWKECKLDVYFGSPS